MKKIILAIPLLFCWCSAWSQGCIAVRNLVGFGQFALPQYEDEPTKWLINVNTRSLEFEKEYWNTDNQNIPSEDQKPTHVFITDFSITRLLDKGWSFSIDLPITAGDRTSWQEHWNTSANKTKFTTRSFGLSDIRITGYKWLLDISQFHKGNIQLGVGLKLPTGDYRFQDFYHKQDKAGNDSLVLAPVNQSIQLGDGGTGFSIEVNGYYTVSKNISLYGNGFYLFSPRNVNGTASLGANVLSKAQINATAGINSVADAFTVRVGANFTFDKFTFGFGGRFEGTPVHDLIGASDGNRRAGSVGSIEPSVNYKMKKMIVYAFVPMSMYRNSRQVVPDQRLGIPSKGGFSDYMIFLGVLFKM